MAADQSSSGPPPHKKLREHRGLQFDMCPRTVDVTEFVEARAFEITQLLAVVNNASLPAGEVAQGPRTFVQRLPRHMRRRAMSYNIKRLPRRIRLMAESTIRESKHRKKPPSRRWRRRPRNLLNAYVRRQRLIQWLETHIWHAKRFHMIDYCGWRLPDRSCQRGFRATYRDAVRHCVVQDFSSYVCLELEGQERILIDRLNTLCQKSVSQTFSNSKALSGCFEGRATLYEPGAYPYGCIGTIRFMFRPKSDENQHRTLWIWAHPALETKLVGVLNRLLNMAESKSEQEVANRDKASDSDINLYHLSKLFSPPMYRSSDSDGPITLRVLKHHLGRFRLIGPKAGLILTHVLHQPPSSLLTGPDLVGHQWEKWNACSRMDVGSVDPNQILPLITVDPRLFTEYKKRLPENRSESLNSKKPSEMEPSVADSALWSPTLRRRSTETKMSDHELNKHRQNINLTSVNILESLDGKANLVPVVLIQQQASSHKDHFGIGAGWDLIFPAGWAMPFWVALQYATAKAVGLDFQRHFALETSDQSIGFPHLWPDTESGQGHAKTEADDLKNRYFRKPINRRVDYERLRITHPFQCPWKDLIDGWTRATLGLDPRPDDDSLTTPFFVLRDRIVLRKLADIIEPKKKMDTQPMIVELCRRYPRALVAVRLSSIGKGVPKPKALICLPTKDDLWKLKSRRTLNESESITQPKAASTTTKTVEDADKEPEFISLGSGTRRDMEVDLATFFEDKKEKRLEERKKKEKERKKKRRKNEDAVRKEETVKVASFDNIIDSCQRRILGYVINGDVSFAIGRGQAIGFCSLLALGEYKRLSPPEAANGVQCIVLYRNVQSNFYRAAMLSVLT